MKPQYIKIDERGHKSYYSDQEMKILHREDGPAEYNNWDKSWYLNGELHREDGPAVEYNNGDKWWYLNGESMSKAEHTSRTAKETVLTMDEYIKTDSYGKFYYKDKEKTILHREGGPAIESYTGDRAWFLNNKLHRMDGPAVEWGHGFKSWYLNGESISEAEHKRRTSKEIILTMNEIAAKFGITVEQLKIKK